jgi:hypothetical protein
MWFFNGLDLKMASMWEQAAIRFEIGFGTGGWSSKKDQAQRDHEA